jgi:hypothetical protein
MSMFDDADLCMQCKEDERLAPGYHAAVEADMVKMKNGDYNFEGVGLSAEDRVFLAERLKRRPL